MGTLKLSNSSGNFVALEPPSSIASDVTLTLPNTDGDANQFLQTNGSGTLSFAVPSNLGTAATASGTNLQFNSGYGSVATAFGVRAWITFDGSASTIGTGNGSGNMDAVTDNGTGDYTLNFTTDMPDANYACVGMCGDNTSGPGGYGTRGGPDMAFANATGNHAAGSVRVYTAVGGSSSGNGYAADYPIIDVIVLR